MKSLNDCIWNDEQFDSEFNSLDCSVSGIIAPVTISKCMDGGIPMSGCGGNPNPDPPASNCPTIDPLQINACILPMGVSCGGGSIPVMSTAGCISSNNGVGDFCNN